MNNDKALYSSQPSPQIDRQATASGHFSAVTKTQRVLKPQRDENCY